jgi:hypothetical protein
VTSAAAWVLPAATAAAGRELLRRAEDERELMRRAQREPGALARHRLARCRAENTEALKVIVQRHGWPTGALVGGPASTAALMLLLHAPDLPFQLRCRDLIAEAAADGHCPAVHLAYIADHCAVARGEPQFYGTRVNPVTLRPYPVRCPETVDERRGDVGLAPLEQQMAALRRGA